ncbi:MAG: hypothetical protein IJB42_02240, partial [Oscillospiraceae bacterium]|nr:hypothetical protein [Oscillospiraceae bacterium]
MTQTRFHKLTAWVLTLAMLFTMLPSFTITALAEDAHSHPICGDAECASHGSDVVWKPIGTKDELLGINEAGYYYLTESIDLGSSLWEPVDGVVLDLCGKTISGTASYMIQLNSDVDFTITDCKDTGKLSHSNYAGCKAVSAAGTSTGFVFTLYNGSIESNGYVYYDENDNGTFNQYGGSITSSGSHTVFIRYGSGKYNLYGGSVANTSESASATAVCVLDGNTQLTMSGDVEISAPVGIQVSNPITIAGALDKPSKPYTIYPMDSSEAFTDGWDDKMSTANPADYFAATSYSPSDYVAVKTDNGELQLAVPITYTVTVAETSNGTVTADKTTAAEGDEITLTVTPTEGYELDILTVKDADNNVVTVTDNKFTMPAKAVTVTATFKTVETAPAAPSYTYELNNISDFMFAVSCTNDSHAVSNEYNIYPSGFATNGEVVKDDEGRWTCDITVRVKACFEENILKGASFSGHSAVSELPESKVFTAIWNSDTEKWEYEGDTVIYEVTCGTDNKPAAPTENNDISAVLLQFSCAEDESHVKVVNIDSAYAVAGEVTENADGEYTCDLTWNVKAAWEGSYGTDFANSFGAHTPSVTLPESKIFSLKYDTASEKWTYAGETASYSVIPAYTVNIADTTNGSVSADKTKAAEGDTVTLTVTPTSGYELDTLTVKDADDNDVTVTDNKFTMPAKAVTVTATFKTVET